MDRVVVTVVMMDLAVAIRWPERTGMITGYIISAIFSTFQCHVTLVVLAP